MHRGGHTLRYPTGSVIASSSQPSVSHSSKAASSRPTITAGMNCLRLMRCEVANERTQVNVEVRVMPLYWLCYRHNNSIVVVIEPGASAIHARESCVSGQDRNGNIFFYCAPPPGP